MLKRDELADPNSCWNKARDDERVFVLLERDDAIAGTIRDWAARRIEMGKNAPGDRKIAAALGLAAAIEEDKARSAKAEGVHP